LNEKAAKESLILLRLFY